MSSFNENWQVQIHSYYSHSHWLKDKVNERIEYKILSLIIFFINFSITPFIFPVHVTWYLSSPLAALAHHHLSVTLAQIYFLAHFVNHVFIFLSLPDSPPLHNHRPISLPAEPHRRGFHHPSHLRRSFVSGSKYSLIRSHSVHRLLVSMDRLNG